MPKPGDRFGDYTVVRLLGKGGMGAVYLLENAEGGQVAAKILDPASSDDHESRKRFLREAELALGVKHPNLVETYDVGEDPDTGLCYILMEYVPGGSLADRLRAGPLPVNDAVRIVYQIASVLELARQKGIVHRDIKPDNIMFGADGKAKLADLGIARGGVGGTETTTVTQTGVMIGTPAYMSPEQMRNSHTVDTRADLYSLGIVFYEMLAGKRPNAGDTPIQLMAKVMQGVSIPDVRILRREVPENVALLVASMCSPQVERRVSTPREVMDKLSDVVHGHASDRSPVEKRNCGRSADVLLFVALALVVSAVVYKGSDRMDVQVEKPTWSWPRIRQAVDRIAGRRPRMAESQPAEVSFVTKGPVAPVADVRPHAVKVEQVMIRSEDGVRRDCVERLAEAVRETLPRALAVFGDPFARGVKTAPYPVLISCRLYSGGSATYRVSPSECLIRVGRNCSFALSDVPGRICASALCFSAEPNWEALSAYAMLLATDGGEREIENVIALGRESDPNMDRFDFCGHLQRPDAPQVADDVYGHPIRYWQTFAPLEELRKEHPNLMKDYYALKLHRGAQNRLYGRMTVEQEIDLFSEIVGEEAKRAFSRYRWIRSYSSRGP